MSLLQKYRGREAIVQICSNQAAIFSLDSPDKIKVLSVTSAIKGIDLWKQHYLVWKVNEAEVFELNPDGIQHLAKFIIPEGASLAIHVNSIFVTVDDGVKVLSLQGELKQCLLVDVFQGKTLQLQVSEEVLIAVTSENRIRIWKIEAEEVKSSGLPSGRKVVINNEPVGKIETLKCNCNGTKVSLLANALNNDGLDSRLFIYDDYLDKFLTYDFGLKNRRPVSHCWDGDECSLLACQTILVDNYDAHELRKTAASQVSTFFVTSDYPEGIFEYEKLELHDDKLNLFGLSVPYLYFYYKNPTNAQESTAVGNFEKITLRDFVGLEEVNQKTKKALISFNYNLILGPIMLVAAYRSILWIQDQAVWRSLAGICIKTKRIDIAIYCFGRMEDACGAELIEKAEAEPEEDARVAMIALQLGQVDDAKELYANCLRYDLLNLLHQHCCEWDKALEVATKFDRVHLKNTHHAYAKYLEARGKLKDAVHHFELSGTYRYEVPRMLYAAQQVEELQDYIDNSSDPSLQRWWAHFCEANDLLSEAIEYYTAAGDICSLVRVHCYQKDFDAAADVVSTSGNSAGAFQLAREYEKSGEILKAIHFFAKAGKSTFAAQLAMKNGVDNELLPLSLQSTKETMLVSARYLELKGMNGEAALLYQKGGDLEAAINICFRSQLLNALEAIVEDLDESADPALLAKCGDYLMQHKQNNKAVELFIAANQLHLSLDICMKEGITITDAMAEGIASKNDDKKTEEAVELLSRLAECCLVQNSYHLACKNYMLAGDHIAGMKALLKSGDTDKIILFANESRQKTVFVLAANYLQTLDWHGDANIMKIIVQMYTQAGEMEQLASFYEACAQIEIDEFRDYEKALGAMSEALKYMNNWNGLEKVQSLQNRIVEMERFVEVREMEETDPTGMVEACWELLLQVSGNNGCSQAELRTGDVYALLIEVYFRQGSMEQAYELIEKMQDRQIQIGLYIDRHIVESIYQALGMEAAEDDFREGIGEDTSSLGKGLINSLMM